MGNGLKLRAESCCRHLTSQGKLLTKSSDYFKLAVTILVKNLIDPVLFVMKGIDKAEGKTTFAITARQKLCVTHGILRLDYANEKIPRIDAIAPFVLWIVH